MNMRALLAAAGLVFLAVETQAADPRERTDAGQFTIYCDDAALRRQVSGFAVRTKDAVLALMEETDGWKRPIVITIDLNPPLDGQQAVVLNLVETVVGMKIEIVARLGHKPADINLQKQITRAVLLEYMYRRDGVKAGAAYVEPPWWVVEGIVETLRRAEGGPEPRFFRALIETNKLPPIESFLTEKPPELGPTALAVDRALAMGLLRLLIEQPGGRRRLAALVRNWPAGDGDPVAALGREFPALKGGAPALQKWWTLNLARFAAGDRVEGMTAEDTNRALTALLEFEIRTQDGEARRFAVGDFGEYLKLPDARGVLSRQRAGVIAMSARANVLLKPVLEEYADIFAVLARGKTRGVADRLERAARLRERITRRADEIADYLNWFEATQFGSMSGAFDNYLKTAEEIERQKKEHRDPIGRYLDEFEKNF